MKAFKRLKGFTVVLIVIQMVFGGMVNAYANEDEIVGEPNIGIVNGPVYEVEAGKINDVVVTVRNFSPDGARSIIVMPKINEIANNPLTITMKNSESTFSVLQPNANKNLTFNVGVDKSAVAGTYSVDVTFSYYNVKGVIYSSSSTIYFKVKNTSGASNFSIESVTVSPDGLEPGGSGVISINLNNRGGLTLYNAEASVVNVDSSQISVTGMSTKKTGTMEAGITKSVNFDILANSSLSTGSFPVNIVAKAQDENGVEYSANQIFYVSVGASTSGKKGDVEIVNVKEPSGTYGVNQNFNIAFDVRNRGDAVAKDVKVTVRENGESGSVVPKSNSIVAVGDLAAGSLKPVSVTMAATDDAKTRNYTIEIFVEYVQNGKVVSFSQYAGVNINNADGDGESKPKIIVSQYTSDPMIVMAGEEFDLTMAFLNTHAQKTVKNVKMFLTLSEETSSDTQRTGNIFTPVNSSNTFYFDSIPSKQTVEKVISLYVVPDAQPKTYTLTVNFEYEDDQGNEYTATELLGINVKQATKIETSEIYLAPSSEIFMPMYLYFDIYNTGKVDISNMKVELSGDIDTTVKSVYLGNCTKGESLYYEGNFSVINEGTNNVVITISYEDPNGEIVEEVKEYVVEGFAPMYEGEFPMDDGMVFPDEGMKSGLDKRIMGILIALLLAVIAVAVTLIKKAKAKKDAKFVEDDDDDEIEIVEEGNGRDEQL